MASRREPANPETEGEAALRHPEKVKASELVALINQVNPTGLELPKKTTERRYALKSKLQSLLLRRFPEDVIVTRVEKQQALIGLHHRPTDRPAAHALVTELDEDVRSAVQLRLDTGNPGDGRRLQPSPARAQGASKSGATTGDLLQLGRAALAEYDFDTARARFLEAFEAKHSDAAAVALLELLVDHLAAYQDALDVEPQLEDDASDEARALLCVAAAQLGRSEDSLRLAADNPHPRVAPALAVLAATALKEGRFEEAKTLIADTRLRDPTLPELITLDAELADRRSSAREPDEKELRRLVETGDLDAIEHQANALLAKWPESAPARRALKDVSSRRREELIRRLASDAELALLRSEHQSARRLFAEAIGLGATGLGEKLAQVDQTLHAQRQAALVEACVHSLEAGVTGSSLAGYALLEPPLRERARQLAKRVELEWLEGLPQSADAAARTRAVLALREVDRLNPVEQPEQVLALLGPHQELVTRLEHGKQVLARAHEAVGALLKKQAQAQALLAEAAARQDAARRVQRFDELLAAKRPLDALRVLREAEEDPATWSQRRAALGQAMRAELQLEILDSPSGAASPEFDQLTVFGEDTALTLDSAGVSFYWLSTWGKELFIHRTSTRDGLTRTTVALTLPEPLRYPSVVLSGEVLSIAGNDCALLQLSVATWEVLTWRSALTHAAGEIIDDVVLAQDGRHLWASIREQKTNRDCLRVVDLLSGRTVRELNRDGFRLQLLARPGPAHVFLNGHERGGRLMSLTGTTELALPAGLLEVSPIPGSSDLLGVQSAPEEKRDDEEGPEESLFLVRIIDGEEFPILDEELEGADPDATLVLAPSFAAGTVVLRHDAGESLVSVYDLASQGTERLWRVEVPQRSGLVQDVGGQRMFLVSRGEDRLQVALLDRARPEMRPSREPYRPPMLWKHDYCQPRYGENRVALHIREASPEAARKKMLDDALATMAGKVGELQQLVTELRQYGLSGHAQVAAAFVRKHHGGSPFVLMDAVQESVEAAAWEGALERAQQLDEKELTPQQLAHLHHLKGLAHYHLGKLREAMVELGRAAAIDKGPCHVSAWPAWLDALANPDLNLNSEAARFVTMIREADRLLEKGDGAAALRLLDVASVWAALEVQLSARLAEAVALAGSSSPELRVRARLINAAFLDEYEDSRAHGAHALPLGDATWPAERLEAIRRRIAAR